MEEKPYPEASIPFPIKLFKLMSKEEDNGVEWVCEGYAFKITDQQVFVDEIIPKYFKHTKLTSFQRQLNLYDFRRLIGSEYQGAYFHPSFRRNRFDLVKDISRLPSKTALLTIEEVMKTGQKLATTRKKRSAISNFVTPSGASRQQQSKSDLTGTAQIGTYKKPELLASGPVAYRTRHNMPTSAIVSPLATNSFDLPLLQIPIYQYSPARGLPHSSINTLTGNMEFSESAETPQTSIFSPLCRQSNEFLDLCPDLIGSPYFAGLMGSALPSPMGQDVSIFQLGSPILNPVDKSVQHPSILSSNHSQNASALEPPVEDQWLIGHSAEAFDKLLDMMYPRSDDIHCDILSQNESYKEATCRIEQNRYASGAEATENEDIANYKDDENPENGNFGESCTEGSSTIRYRKSKKVPDKIFPFTPPPTTAISDLGAKSDITFEMPAQIGSEIVRSDLINDCAATEKEKNKQPLNCAVQLANFPTNDVWDVQSVLHAPYQQVEQQHSVLIADTTFLTSSTMLLSEGSGGRVHVRKSHFS